MFHYSLRVIDEKNERNSNFELGPQKDDFGIYLEMSALNQNGFLPVS